ncbi:MAG: HEPN domain-containing protein [Thermoleophilaceae bacterium]
MTDWVAPIERAREELRAARALLRAGLPSQAVSRSYSAGFHAATATLLALGETYATETAVISAFGRRAVGEQGVDQAGARTLRKLYEDRNDVDYALMPASEDEARRAIDGADRLVNSAVRWLSKRPKPRAELRSTG